jgi:hypothetical protein
MCGMYCLVPAQYKVVQGGTRWYKVVQGGTNNGIWRYIKVQGRTRIVKIVQAGTYWHVLGDKLAGQVLGCWTSPRAGFLEDVVVECGGRVA